MSGLVADKYPKYLDLVIALAYSGMGMTLLIKPWSPTVDVLCLLAGINGISGGFFICQYHMSNRDLSSAYSFIILIRQTIAIISEDVHLRFSLGTVAVHFSLFGSESMPMYIRHLGWTVTCPLIPLMAKDFLSDPIDVLRKLSFIQGWVETYVIPSVS